MKDNYDFSKGTKNPYVEKLKKGYTVTVHYGFTTPATGKARDNKEENKPTPDEMAAFEENRANRA